MKTLNFLISACRYCRYYKPEGRRGGVCQQLEVPVQGSWKACCLALPAFAPSWESLEEMMILPDETPVLSHALPLVYPLDSSSLAAAELEEVGGLGRGIKENCSERLSLRTLSSAT